MKTRLLLLALLAMCLPTLSAQVVINEYSASNLNGFRDSFGKTEDWIELYNTSDNPVNISGWHLSDKESKPKKWEVPEGTVIPAKGFLVFLCSGRDRVVNGEYHTNFKLSQTSGKDYVLLADKAGTTLEVYPLALTLVEHSRCRLTDGAANWAISTQPSFGSSNNEAPKVNDYTLAPSINLEAGFYDGPQTVTITNNEPNSILRYTTDGTNPTQQSTIYNGPLTVSNTQVIKARAFSNDPLVLPGKMIFNTYFIGETYSLAVFSVAADQVIELANGAGELIPIGSIEYFNTEKEREAISFGSLNRHGQDSWQLDHRSLDWISRDEMGYNKAVQAPIFDYSDRDEYQRFMFRNSGDDNYPAINDGNHDGSAHVRDEFVQTLAQEGGLKLDVRGVKRVILFLNGKYWGVYGMREKVVDHDFTDEYYKQDKYDLQYLSTWQTTEIEYGGLKALEDWTRLRDFILENDMSLPENYKIAEDSINLTSLIDYFLMNQATVASDWLNYNTGWWRGLNPDGKHKKWGYILWDLDATFDYYINYTGIPNTKADASLCDIYPISEAIDDFFSQVDTATVDTLRNCSRLGGNNSPYPDTDSIFIQVINADNFCCSTWDEICQELYDDFADPRNSLPIDSCLIIKNGTSPYPADDPILQQVISVEPACCAAWDGDCQAIYSYFEQQEADTSGLTGITGNVGKHEKILLKLLEENADFKQLYYSRYADLMNTVFSCDTMNQLLDRMIAVIEDEMPRQINRWGGSMGEWRDNVARLRSYIDDRCLFLNQQAMECHGDVEGQYGLTLMTEPAGIGEIDLNTLDIEKFPWYGEYFGGMSNKIKAKVFDEFDDEYEFSHWESKAGNSISPTGTDRKATLVLNTPDTLTAVFRQKGTTNTQDLLSQFDFKLYPNPTSDQVTLSFQLEETSTVVAEMYAINGQKITTFPISGQRMIAGKHTVTLPLTTYLIPSGLYLLKVQLGEHQGNFKLNVLR